MYVCMYTHDYLVQVNTYKACVMDSRYILIYIFFVHTYILYIETHRPNTNRYVHAHKCLHCAGIEPSTSSFPPLRHIGHPYGLPTRRTGHPHWASADWWLLTTANTAGTNGLTCLPKHRGARDNIFLVTHPMTDLCCLASATERRAH
jgi:hypothetical protein